MSDAGFDLLDSPQPPGSLHPGVRVKLIKQVLREADASIRLQEFFGRPASDKLALVHKDRQFKFISAGEVGLSGEQEKEFHKIIKDITVKHNKGGPPAAGGKQAPAGQQPADTHPGVRIKLLKQILRDVDGNPRLQEMFGRPASDKLALVHRDGQFQLTNSREIDLTGEQEKEFHEIIKTIIPKHKKRK